MLAEVTVTNTETTVYTVPSGKSAYVYVDIYSPNMAGFTLKVNNKVYYNDSVNIFSSFKMALNASDELKVSTTGTVNVFVHGMEV